MNNYSNLEIPLLLKDLNNLVCLEIGVERGGSAYNILKNCDVKMMYLLDPYLPYTDYSTNHLCDAECQIQNKFICSELLREFNNFQFVEKKSDDSLSMFQDETFDYSEGVNRAINEFSKKIGKEVLNCKNDVWYWYK